MQHLHGHDIKYQLLLAHVFFNVMDGGPSRPPSIQSPRPVFVPSSHHPHEGFCWHEAHVFRSAQRVAGNENI